MLHLLFGVQAPKQIKLLQTITKKPPTIIKVVEPTLQEKIASNYYKCDESKFWIRADNAMCLPKPVQTVNVTTQVQKPVTTSPKASQSASNTYTPGQCTWHTKNVLGWVPNGLGDASSWASNAVAQGYTLSDTPKIGAVAWRYGHVAAVIGVGDGTVTISEQNYDWNGSIRTITVPVSSYKYIY